MTSRLSILSLALTAAFSALPAAAQASLQVSVATGGSSTTVTSGGTVALTGTDAGQPVLATATVRNTGSSPIIVTGISATGTSEITVQAGALPATLNPGGAANFTIQYLPATGNAVFAQVTVAYTENTQAGAFPFIVSGTSPRFTYSYYFIGNGALTDINSGDRITFPGTNAGATSTAVLTVLNRGAGTGALQSVSLSGPAFTLSDSPAPVDLPPGSQASFSITFSPTASAGNQGLLVLGLGKTSVSFSLAGTGTTPAMVTTYSLADGNVWTLSDGTAIIFPNIDPNATTVATIEIANLGTGVGSVTNISLSGPGFRLAGVPVLPAKIAAGQSLKFTITFAPTQSTLYTGTFRIDMPGRSISGSLSGSPNLAAISATYTLSDGVSRSLPDGTLITFPAADINGTATANIDLANRGPGAGQLTGVTVSGTGFRLTGVPALPATIAAGQTARFSIAFTPAQAGSFSGTFRIDLSGASIFGALSGSTAAPDFTVSYTLANGVPQAFPDGAAITIPSVDINATSTANIDVTNRGQGAGSITGVSLTGAGFRLTGVPVLPAAVGAGQTTRFGIVFAPTATGPYTGTFRIDFGSRSVSGTLNASTSAPTLTLSYISPDTSNTAPLADGATLNFPNTAVNASTTVTLQAGNTGVGTGTLNSVVLSASAGFELVNLPSMPLSVPPGQQTRFGVRFTPKEQQSHTGTLMVMLENQPITINLQAQGVGPLFTYTYTQASGGRSVVPGGTIAVDDTLLGQTTSSFVTVTNSGTADGVVPGIAVTGTGFALADLPALPLTLKQGASQYFTLNFTPAQPGAVTGRLTVGGETFTLSGTGLGSRLTFSYTSAGTAVPVADGGVMLFPPVQVGNNQSLDFTIKNTGTSPAALSTIALVAPSTVFTLRNVPGLPVNLDPGATVLFPVSFAPNNTGNLTATLRVNNASLTLSGTGMQPSPLPSYQFEVPSANPKPGQQPTVGLALTTPYPLAVQGTLRLSFVSSVFADDPAVQFSNGSRTVNFTIPANSTRAAFNGGAATVALQTGTTAGDIIITPSFGTAAGLDLTPATADTLTFNMPRTVPEILSATISSQTLTSFSVLISGYSTTRSIRRLEIDVTPKSGQNIASSHLTLDVTGASSAWFQSTASQPYGGTFLISIPFVLQNGSSTDDVVRRLQSLTITGVNDVGSSSAVTVTIP